MSVALPATPRRNVLHAHPQGLSTMPSFVPSGLDKSPSIRAALQHPRASAASSTFGRSLLTHKSHPPLQTPVALGNVSIMDQTATAPPRLPVPRQSAKRARGPDSDGIEFIRENHEYHHDVMECLVACTSGHERDARPSMWVGHSPRPPAPASVLHFPSEDYHLRQTRPSRIIGTSRTQVPPLKRARPPLSPSKPGTSERWAKKPKFDNRAAERGRPERQHFEERFRDKYTRAFPNFKFYFDFIDPPVKTSLSNRVQQLGARIEDFFSASVTHFITNKPVPTAEDIAALENKENKENAPDNEAPRSFGSRSQSVAPPPLRSPVKLRVPVNKYDTLVTKAVHFNMKIWDERKLDNILSRLLPTIATSHHNNVHVALNAQSHTENKATLSYLLETERNTGITHERDPTAQRQDYRYFPKGTYWLLIEDMDGTHAPIAVKDYGRWKPGRIVKVAKSQPSGNAKKRKQLETFFDYATKDAMEEDEEALPPWPPLRDQQGKAKPDWAYDKVSDSDAEVGVGDFEAGAERESLGDEVEIEIQQLSDEDGNGNDEGPGEGSVTDGEGGDPPPTDIQTLRRTASMHDMGRTLSVHPAGRQTSQSRSKGPQKRLRGADREYNAASGNSVTITSHVNSTTSYAFGGGYDLGPGARQIEKRLHQQVLTRAAAGSVSASGGGSMAGMTRKSSVSITESQRVLRRAKSTNALRARGLRNKGSGARARLPSREEVKKPGYCENCRLRFDDFNKHIAGKRHQRFAEDDDNFTVLDEIFAQLSPHDTNNSAYQFEEMEDDGEGEVDEDDDDLEIIGEPSPSATQYFKFRGLRQSVRANLQRIENEQDFDLTMQLQSTFPNANTEPEDIDMDDPFVAH